MQIESCRGWPRPCEAVIRAAHAGVRQTHSIIAPVNTPAIVCGGIFFGKKFAGPEILV